MFLFVTLSFSEDMCAYCFFLFLFLFLFFSFFMIMMMVSLIITEMFKMLIPSLYYNWLDAVLDCC